MELFIFFFFIFFFSIGIFIIEVFFLFFFYVYTRLFLLYKFPSNIFFYVYNMYICTYIHMYTYTYICIYDVCTHTYIFIIIMPNFSSLRVKLYMRSVCVSSCFLMCKYVPKYTSCYIYICKCSSYAFICYSTMVLCITIYERP